ncbi:hypothetical protein GMDG_01269 [Pseudogymnoascus destructans 20631-21]|uniref:Uncharacterized protein n=1 Tax=Pseudogymnoascus destructans (strain ATCC MYA-4855 / 20631-21) TaxID=658429 RepID=L8FSR0_PSED2|nr:hypothetical protein GMDG_01269 [Pseudogymnoascus destructans 20631-21]
MQIHPPRCRPTPLGRRDIHAPSSFTVINRTPITHNHPATMAPLRRYLRITPSSVLEVRIYPSPPGAWLLSTRSLLTRVLAAVRPLILPKLREENERVKARGRGLRMLFLVMGLKSRSSSPRRVQGIRFSRDGRFFVNQNEKGMIQTPIPPRPSRERRATTS